MKDLVGERVRCLSSGRVYRAVAQSGNDIIGRDELTGEHMGLSAERVVRHSPALIALGIVIQTVLFADSGPLGNIAHLVRGGLFGSFLATFAAWRMDLSLPLIVLAYLVGGLVGVMVSAGLRYRRQISAMTRTMARTKPPAGRSEPPDQAFAASWREPDEP